MRFIVVVKKITATLFLCRVARGISARREGFSLFEIILVAGIAAVFVFVVAGFQTNLNIMQNLTNQELQSRQDVDQTFQIMTTEIRSAGPSSLGAYAIDSAGTSSFAFYSDIDKDGLFERLRYFLGTSTVQKGVIKPAGNPLVYATSSETVTSVVNNVRITSSTKLFNYYDANYTGTQPSMTYPIDVTQIRLVQFSVYVDVNASSAPKASFFSSIVDIRNLRSN